MAKRLPPSVEHRGYPDLGAEVLGIGGDRAQGVDRRLEQEVVDHRLVVEGDRGDRPGQGEDHVEVGHRQQLGVAVGEPLGARQALTLRAVPVATGIVGDTDHAAIGAPFDMTAERCCPARFDRAQDPPLAAAQAVSVRGAIGGAVVANDVRHLERRAHGTALRVAASPSGSGGRAGSGCPRSCGSRPGRSGRWSPAGHGRAGLG